MAASSSLPRLGIIKANQARNRVTVDRRGVKFKNGRGGVSARRASEAAYKRRHHVARRRRGENGLARCG